MRCFDNVPDDWSFWHICERDGHERLAPIARDGEIFGWRCAWCGCLVDEADEEDDDARDP